VSTAAKKKGRRDTDPLAREEKTGIRERKGGGKEVRFSHIALTFPWKNEKRLKGQGREKNGLTSISPAYWEEKSDRTEKGEGKRRTTSIFPNVGHRV